MINIKITNEVIKAIKREIFEAEVAYKMTADKTKKEEIATRLAKLKQVLRKEMEVELKEAVLKKEAIIAGKKLADTPPSKREELIDIMIKGKEDIYDQYKRR